MLNHALVVLLRRSLPVLEHCLVLVECDSLVHLTGQLLGIKWDALSPHWGHHVVEEELRVKLVLAEHGTLRSFARRAVQT